MASNATADSMRAYYAQRATTYERVYLKPERQADLRAMETQVARYFKDKHVLEVACGTGWWTAHGARDCRSWLATDVNPETMAITRAKPLPAGKVQFATVDAYTFAELGNATFDAALAGCWWSHVPLSRLAGWLDLLHARLEPGAGVVMLDNRYVPGSSTPIARTDTQGNTYQTRPLDDGSVHEVLKNYPTREQAFAVLGARAVAPQWVDFGHYWLLTYDLA
jgi:SAM-dependent methyltransferase